MAAAQVPRVEGDEQQLEALALVCTSLNDVRTMCAALCTSSSARQAILDKCIGTLHLKVRTLAEDENGRSEAAAMAALRRVNHQAAWLAQYGALVGQLQLFLDPNLHEADAAALYASLRPPVQLRQLQLSASAPAALLKQLDPSSLTTLELDLTSSVEYGATSQPLAAALRRLTNLQQLVITGDQRQPHASMPAALAGMPQLTQLVLEPQLPAAALAQLPSQLVELQLLGPDCDAAELTTHVGALQHLRMLELAYSTSAAVQARMLNHASAWSTLAALRQLTVIARNAEHTVDVLAGAAVATHLTQLAGCFSGIGRGTQLSQLSSLRQLQELSIQIASPNNDSTVYSWGQLFSHDLTQLRSLDVWPGKMRQLAHMQLLFHPTQLTQLVLREILLDEQGYEVIAANLTQLQRLALIDCGGFSRIPVLISSQRLPSLEQLGLCSSQLTNQVKRVVAQSRLKELRPSLHTCIVQYPSEFPAGFVGHTHGAFRG